MDDFEICISRHVDEICNALKQTESAKDPKAPFDGFDESDIPRKSKNGMENANEYTLATG